MPRFAPGETVWADDPLSLSGGVGAFEVLDVLEDFDEDYTDYVLLLAKPDDRERSFCVSQDRAYRTKEEAEACARRRQNRSASKEAEAKRPKIDHDRSKEDHPVGNRSSVAEAMAGLYFLSKKEFRDKYMGILFKDEAEFKAFAARVDGAVEAVFRKLLVEVRPIGEAAK